MTIDNPTQDACGTDCHTHDDPRPEQPGRALHRARRLVAASLFLLAAYIAFDAVGTLWQRDPSEFSAVGVALTGLSLIVMLWLARAKRRVGMEVG